MANFKVKRLEHFEQLAKRVDTINSNEQVDEDSVSPGASPQVPGSISGMGNPVAPTPTSIGSGDNFNPSQKRKKKGKKILEFSEFNRL